jgi:hypothetical protein
MRAATYDWCVNQVPLPGSHRDAENAARESVRDGLGAGTVRPRVSGDGAVPKGVSAGLSPCDACCTRRIIATCVCPGTIHVREDAISGAGSTAGSRLLLHRAVALARGGTVEASRPPRDRVCSTRCSGVCVCASWRVYAGRAVLPRSRGRRTGQEGTADVDCRRQLLQPAKGPRVRTSVPETRT